MLSHGLSLLANNPPVTLNDHRRFWFCVHEAGHFTIACALEVDVDYVIANSEEGITQCDPYLPPTSMGRLASAGIGAERFVRREFIEPATAHLYSYLPVETLLTTRENLHAGRITTDYIEFKRSVLNTTDREEAFICCADASETFFKYQYVNLFCHTICALYDSTYIGSDMINSIKNDSIIHDTHKLNDLGRIPRNIREHYHIAYIAN